MFSYERGTPVRNPRAKPVGRRFLRSRKRTNAAFSVFLKLRTLTNAVGRWSRGELVGVGEFFKAEPLGNPIFLR